MKIRIVADSSCDLLELKGIDFISVPLSICTDENEYVDDANLDVELMIEQLLAYHGRSFTSCPNISMWENAFEGADKICVFTISKGISGSYGAAAAARDSFIEGHPDVQIHIVNTLSAGPEITMAIKKMQELLLGGTDFDTACEIVDKYAESTALLFALKSLHNFAQNGRVSKVAAAACGLLSIHAVGRASDQGTLDVLARSRGANKMLVEMVSQLKVLNYSGGKALIGHVFNEKEAAMLKTLIEKEYPNAEITIHPMRGLCCYYAERGGLLLGFERA